MMKSYFFILMLIGSVCVFGQAYKPELDGKFLPAKVIFGDGVVQEVNMMYQQPELFKNPLNRFHITKTTPNGSSNTYEHVGGIEAFMIDNTVWALRSVAGQNQFVILKRQGVIEQYEYVINGKIGDVKPSAYVVLGERTKTIWKNTAKNETIEGKVSDSKIKEWIADSPEVLEDLKAAEARTAEVKAANATSSNNQSQQPVKKGLMGAIEKSVAKEAEAKKAEEATVDMNRIINNYNVWFERNNPGKIKYHFSPTMSWQNLPAKVKTADELKSEQKAELEKQYAHRSASVNPLLASAKDNTPEKKETFSAKLQRLATDGNKVAVVLKLAPVRKVAPGAYMAPGDSFVSGEEYWDDTLVQAGEQLVQELSQALGTTNIELVNINNVPYREVKVMGMTTRVDDWWATKYKVVFMYTLDPRLKSEIQEIGGKMKNTASINVLSSMIVTEYIGATTSTKQDILAQVLNLGGFATPVYAQDEEFGNIKSMYEKAQEKLTTPLVDKIKMERAEGVTKVVNKLTN